MAFRIDPPDISSFRGDQFAVIYPGLNGTREGYNRKYVLMPFELGLRGISTARTDNPAPYVHPAAYRETLVAHLQETVSVTLEYAMAECGVPRPRLYLIGVSDGASAVAAIAGDYAELEGVLLIAP